MTYRDALANLTAALPALNQRDQDFANSLLAQAADGGWLSDKQWHWVRKLADKAAPADAPAAAPAANLAGVVTMFQVASKTAKFPKIRLQLDDGRPVVLSCAGPAAKVPGAVYVSDGRAFDVRTRYGMIDPASGAWNPADRVDAATATAVAALLVNLASDAQGVAKAYGVATSSCCFCGICLTDPRSVTAGYGPICADRFSLPWGD